MKTLFVLLLTTSSLIINTSFDVTLLEGKWKYYDIYEKEKLDAKSLDMTKQFFGDMKMEFGKDKSYSTFIMGKTEKGKWEVNSKKKEFIDLTSENERVSSLEIISLTKDQLVISTGKAKFVMVRE